MGILNTTVAQYYQGNEYGNYQFTSLEDIINQFMIVYVGEVKVISKARRVDVAFHAQRALAELSFDTFKSIKSQEIEVPATLVMPLPHDYVNYTKISSVEIRGSAFKLAVMSSIIASFSASVNGSNMASYMIVPNSGFSTLSPLRTLNLLIRSCFATSKSYSLKFCLSARELKPLKVTVLFDKPLPDPPSPYAITVIS